MKKNLWTKDDRYRMNNQTYEIFYNYTTQKMKTDIHQHDFYEILFFIQGEANFFIEGRQYSLSPNDIIVSSPGELHCVNITNNQIPYERIVIWLHPDLMKSLCEKTQLDLKACFDSTKQSHYHLFHLFGLMKDHVRHIFDQFLGADPNDFGSVIFQYCLMIEFLILLNRAFLTSDHNLDDLSYHPKIDAIVKYISQHLQDDLSLDHLAKNFFISKYYLTRLFKQYTGQSLHQFVLRKRLAVARRLMQEGSTPMNAALDTGFINYSHFSKAFKDQFGFSPSDID